MHDAPSIKFLEQLRWPDGPVCPDGCGKNIGRLAAQPRYQCKSCRKQFTVTSDTPLAGLRDLEEYIIAIKHDGCTEQKLIHKLGVSKTKAYRIKNKIAEMKRHPNMRGLFAAICSSDSQIFEIEHRDHQLNTKYMTEREMLWAVRQAPLRFFTMDEKTCHLHVEKMRRSLCYIDREKRALYRSIVDLFDVWRLTEYSGGCVAKRALENDFMQSAKEESLIGVAFSVVWAILHRRDLFKKNICHSIVEDHIEWLKFQNKLLNSVTKQSEPEYVIIAVLLYILNMELIKTTIISWEKAREGRAVIRQMFDRQIEDASKALELSNYKEFNEFETYKKVFKAELKEAIVRGGIAFDLRQDKFSELHEARALISDLSLALPQTHIDLSETQYWLLINEKPNSTMKLSRLLSEKRFEFLQHSNTSDIQRAKIVRIIEPFLDKQSKLDLRNIIYAI